MVLRASQRVTELIREIASGQPAKEIAAAGKLPANPPDVSLSYQKCDQVVGLAIKPKTVDEILARFGLAKAKTAKTTSAWKVPSYRRDLQRYVDLIEEVVRAHGVDKISGTDRSRFTPSSPADHSHDLESSLRERLVAYGLSEARTSKLIPRTAIASGENAIQLRNPLSEDHVALRPSLISGLLGVLDRNVRAGAERVATFELGRVFVPPDGKEERRLGILLWGKMASASHWRTREKRQLDFVDLKGAIESLTIPKSSFRQGKHVDLAMSTEIYCDDKAIGFAGQLRSGKIDAPGAVFIAELHVDLVLGALASAKTFREIERFPAITRDIAMIVPEKISHAEILRAIENPKESLLESVQLFDLFTEAIGEARKSLAYRLTYRDRSRTLTSEEVTAAHAKIRERLQRELSAELRE
jgi:phenylalanyl-tRNA synthetase beta chain